MWSSPRFPGELHCVVGRNGKIVFDPHTDRSGLAGDPKEWLTGFIINLCDGGQVAADFDGNVEEPLKMTNIKKSDYRHRMTIEKFIDNVKEGWVVMDDDGFGYYATATQESNKCVDCDVNVLNEVKAEGVFTHVMWYNK